MNTTDASNLGLERLHDILLPDPVSWMPQTVGWIAVAGLVMVVIGWWVYGRFQRFRKDRYRRVALTELEAIEQKLKDPEKRARALTEIPVLVKWAALMAFPRRDVASLSGGKWTAFLGETMGEKGFPEEEGRLLCDLAYAPPAQISRLPEEGVKKLLPIIRLWIKMHQGSSHASI